MIDIGAANHTNCELELMLSGRKPLAIFYALTSELPNEELIPEEQFAPHVANGKFVRSEAEIHDLPNDGSNQGKNIKFVFFATKDEDWRIKAMLLLKEQHAKTNLWNETCERTESALLGYTDEEIEAWCKKAFTKQAL